MVQVLISSENKPSNEVVNSWMIKIHCVNLHTELAVKGAIAETEFSKVDDYYSTKVLLKNSGKIWN